MEPKTYNWSPMIDDYDINYGAIIVSCTWESTMCIGCKVTYTRRMILNFGLDIPHSWFHYVLYKNHSVTKFWGHNGHGS